MWLSIFYLQSISVATTPLAHRLFLHNAAVTDYPDSPKPCNELGSILLGAGRYRAALRNYEKALARSAAPDDDDGWDASVNLALCLISLAEQRPDLYHNRLPEARAHVHRCLVSTPSDQRILALLARADAIAPRLAHEADDARFIVRDASDSHQARAGVPLVRSWQPEEVSSSSSSGGALLICFAGADANLGGGIRGGMPSHEFVASCRRAGVRKALFVRDCLRSWYLRGIGNDRIVARTSDDGDDDGVGDDDGSYYDAIDDDGYVEPISHHRSFEGVVSHLQSEIDRVQPSRLVTIGSSMGGYAAIRAGLALNADVAVAFSPQVVIHAAERKQLNFPQQPFDGLLNTLVETTQNAAGIPLTSLIECVASAPDSCNTLVEMHVGRLEEGDVREAKMLQAAVDGRRCSSSGGGGGGGGVACALTVHDGRDHNLVKEMRDDGELHELLRRVAGLASAPAAASEDAKESGAIAEGFVGFRDCGDL